MPIQKSQSDCIQTGNTGWISIHINDPEFSIERQKCLDEGSRRDKQVAPASCHVFEHVQDMPISLAERFPRLTFFAVALTLLLFALTAEFDYLHSAGYYWP